MKNVVSLSALAILSCLAGIASAEDVYRLERPDTSSDFGSPMLVAELSDPVFNDISPDVSKDGDYLVLGRNDLSGDGVRIASRRLDPPAGVIWCTPAKIEVSDDPLATDKSPCIVHTNQHILFRSTRAGGPGTKSNIWYMKRTE